VGGGNCIPVARLEDAKISDLIGLLGEILEGKKAMSGSVVLIGSGSHLIRVGACAYAFDWCEAVAACKNKWPDLSICPLVPIFGSDLPGHVARDVTQLSVWLHEVYSCLPNGMLKCWDTTVEVIGACARGSTLLQCPETLKMPMPTGLSGPGSTTFVFEFDHTCPVQVLKPDRKATIEVVTCIIHSLGTCFSVHVCPELILSKANSQGDALSSVTKAVAVGASIMRQNIPFLKDCGMEVKDFTRGGWVASPESSAEMAAKLAAVGAESDTVVILDLFSNSVFRFAQADGTLALPVKLGDKYHMLGPVHLVGEAGLKKILDTVRPILNAVPSNPKIIVPPYPRYLGSGCCSDKTHCPNCRGSEFAGSQLDGLCAMRKIL